MFSLFISEVADFVRENGKHGIQLIPGLDEIFLLLFADIVLLSSTPAGLQNQIDNLENASKSLDLTVNLDKTKVMIFRKGGHIAAREKWFYDGKEIETVNSYKYVGFTLTAKLSNNSACEEYASKTKGKILDLMQTGVLRPVNQCGYIRAMRKTHVNKWIQAGMCYSSSEDVDMLWIVDAMNVQTFFLLYSLPPPPPPPCVWVGGLHNKPYVNVSASLCLSVSVCLSLYLTAIQSIILKYPHTHTHTHTHTQPAYMHSVYF